MDQASILAFLSNLIQDPYTNMLNDPYSRMGLQNTMQMQAQQQALSDEDANRLLLLARGIDPRATIPTRSVGSIFNPGEPTAAPQATPTLTPAPDFPTGPKLEPPSVGLTSNYYGVQQPFNPPPMDQRDIVARAMHERQQLNPVGGIFPSTLKDYWMNIFQPRPAIYRGQAPIGPTYTGPTVTGGGTQLSPRGGNIYGR